MKEHNKAELTYIQTKNRKAHIHISKYLQLCSADLVSIGGALRPGQQLLEACACEKPTKTDTCNKIRQN